MDDIDDEELDRLEAAEQQRKHRTQKQERIERLLTLRAENDAREAANAVSVAKRAALAVAAKAVKAVKAVKTAKAPVAQVARLNRVIPTLANVAPANNDAVQRPPGLYQSKTEDRGFGEIREYKASGLILSEETVQTNGFGIAGQVALAASIALRTHPVRIEFKFVSSLNASNTPSKVVQGIAGETSSALRARIAAELQRLLAQHSVNSVGVWRLTDVVFKIPKPRVS